MAAFRDIDLRLLDSSAAKATGLGNNAAWLCPCGRALPLIASLVIAREVSCPTCGKHYRLLANAANQADTVQQITSRRR